MAVFKLLFTKVILGKKNLIKLSIKNMVLA